MMNMVPHRDMFNSMNMLTNDIYDFLAPLQILNGNSLADYNLNSDTIVTDNLVDETSKKNVTKFISVALKNLMNSS